jgi:hypothetical protein
MSPWRDAIVAGCHRTGGPGAGGSRASGSARITIKHNYNQQQHSKTWQLKTTNDKHQHNQYLFSQTELTTKFSAFFRVYPSRRPMPLPTNSMRGFAAVFPAVALCFRAPPWGASLGGGEWITRLVVESLLESFLAYVGKSFLFASVGPRVRRVFYVCLSLVRWLANGQISSVLLVGCLE